MPTYFNPNKYSIAVEEVGISLNPGRTSSLVYIPDAILARYANNNITKLSEIPYYNPILQANNLIFEVTDEVQELDINYLCDFIHLVDATANFTIYINTVDNLPSIKVRPTEDVKLFNRFTIGKLFIKASIQSSIYVTQNKNYITEYHDVNRDINTLY